MLKLKHKCDKVDIDNNVKFRYYDIKSSYLKVNNQYPCSLYTEEIGKEVNIIIEDTNKDNDLIIKLYYDGVNYNYLKVKYNDLPTTRITLVSIGFNINYGTKWYVKNYNGNILVDYGKL